MPENEKQVWRQRAAQVKEEHKKRYPGYKFIPGQKISERSAMAQTLKVAEKRGKTLTTTSQPISVNSPARQPEIPFFVVPSRSSIQFETTKPRFDDCDTLSDDSVSASFIIDGHVSYPWYLKQSINGVALPTTSTTGYDPYQPYQSVLDVETMIDHDMAPNDEIVERNAKVFSSMQMSMCDIDDTAMDEEDVDDEEIEKLMKQFIVDLWSFFFVRVLVLFAMLWFLPFSEICQ